MTQPSERTEQTFEPGDEVIYTNAKLRWNIRPGQAGCVLGDDEFNPEQVVVDFYQSGPSDGWVRHGIRKVRRTSLQHANHSRERGQYHVVRD